MKRLFVLLAAALLVVGCANKEPLRVFVPTPERVKAPQPDPQLTILEPRPAVPAAVTTTDQMASVLQVVGGWGDANYARQAGWITWYNCIYLPFMNKVSPGPSCPKDPNAPPSAPVTN